MTDAAAFWASIYTPATRAHAIRDYLWARQHPAVWSVATLRRQALHTCRRYREARP